MNFLLNFLNRHGKVGNKIEINKQNKVFEGLAKIIKNAYTKKDENEISQIMKKGTIREFLSTSLTEGVCYPYLKTVCIKPYMIENIINGKIEQTIIHEIIHLIRGIQNPYKFEKDITGFEEGATEYMTFKSLGILEKYSSKYLLNNKGQKMECNIPTTPYMESTSLMAQLGIIFGEDKLQEFAFGENKDLLKDLQNTCGKDFYELLRKKLNKYATDSIYVHQDVLQLQSELLKRCYTSKFSQIETIDDATTLFNKLQDLNKVRLHFNEDTSFKDFYEEQYEKCVKKFGDDFKKLESLKYQEMEFLNVTSKEQIKNSFNRNIKTFICDPTSDLERSLERIHYTKRYAALHQDTLYQIAIFKDRIVQFSVGNEKEGTVNPTLTSINNKNEEMHKLRKNPSMPKFDSDFYLKKNNNNQNYTLIIDGEEVQLTEIDLGITKEDVESYYTFINSLNQRKTFKERFLNFFSKKKTKLLNEPENTDYTKKETNSRSFKDSVKINSGNNHIDLQNTVNRSNHENTVTLEDKSIGK